MRILLLTLLWLSFALPLRAETPAFAAFFDDLRTFRAEFSQKVVDRYGEIVQQGAGEVFIRRPGQFRWNYTEPYEQVILGDGEVLWTYDADLEQATRKAQKDALMGTPATLLSSGRDPASLFEIEPLDASAGLDWVALTPRDPESQFEAIRLGFADIALRRMVLIDNFGQRTEIRFHQPQRNVELAAGLFEFNPPPGTDIIGEAAVP